MSHDELVAKAKEEAAAAKSAGTVFKAYGTSSRIASAAKAFTELYGIDVETTNVKDSEIYTKLQAEISGKIDGADVVLTQNGAVMKVQMVDTGNLINYIPASVASNIENSDKVPLVQQYIDKLFIFNTVGSDVPAITNVWQLTEPAMKGRVFFKSPETEKVNENFLIMLTNKTWADKLAKAYKNLYGKDIQLGSYKNAGYKWIAEFLHNCSFGNTDTTIAEQISNAEASGKIGLFVLSKLRSKTVRTENLEIASYYADGKNTTVDPFAGFMYPLYVQIVKTTTMPYTDDLASFDDTGKTFSVAKHIVSSASIFTCVTGRSNRIRNIVKTSLDFGDYKLDKTGTICVFGKPYMTKVLGKDSAPGLMQIVAEANSRRKDPPPPLFPPSDLNWHWDLIALLEKDNTLVKEVRLRQRAFAETKGEGGKIDALAASMYGTHLKLQEDALKISDEARKKAKKEAGR